MRRSLGSVFQWFVPWMVENSSQNYQRGNSLRSLGRFEDAVEAYDQALSIQPDFAAALICRGIALRSLMRFEDALKSFDRALTITPKDFGIWLNRGLVLLDLKRFEESLATYDAALALNPGHVWTLNNRALTLSQMGRFDEALAGFEEVIAVNARNWEALNNRGMVLQAMKHSEEALASYEAALAVKPGHVSIMCNRGATLSELERFEEALASFQAALAIDPNHADTWNSRGLTLSQMGRADEALTSFETALAITPGHIDGLTNRAKQLLLLGRFAEARDNYEKLLAINPDDRNAFGGLAELALRMCDWPRVEAMTESVKAGIAAGKSGIPPFILLGYSDDAALQLRCAANHDRTHLPAKRRGSWDGRAYRNIKTRIAYLSSDFRDHPTAQLTAGLFECHDRTRFQVSAISFGPDDGSAMRERLVRAFDDFVDVRGKTDQQIANYLMDNRTDIAVDLNGHTQNERLGILSFRPAPIQVNYLGYPGTIGGDFMDYILADGTVLPFDRQSFFTERIVHLPDCYQVNDSKRAIAAATPSRKQAGLPEHGFVFCCFNNNWKITALIFQVWMRVLRAIPGSVLWLLDCGLSDHLGAEAAARDIDPRRLIFAPRVKPEQHLARHRLADLFLDTIPYNAHTTASDALWAGVPLVTCRGRSFAGRVAASILCSIGLSALVTDNLEDYEELILKIARDPGLLHACHSTLDRNRLTHALFDTNRSCRNIEAAYIRMMEIAERGEAPRSFSVERADQN